MKYSGDFLTFIILLSKFIEITLRHECFPVNLLHISNLTEITFRRGCSPVNLLHIFRPTFTKNTSGLLLLTFSNRNHWSKTGVSVSSSISIRVFISDISLKMTTWNKENFSNSSASLLKWIAWTSSVMLFICSFKT